MRRSIVFTLLVTICGLSMLTRPVSANSNSNNSNHNDISFSSSSSSSSSSSYNFTVEFHYPESKVGFGQGLYIRGNSLGLNWQAGVKMQKSQINVWTYSVQYNSSDIGQVFECKALIGDSTWQIGANSMIRIPSTSGLKVIVYPWFKTSNGQYVYHRNVYSPTLKNTRDLVVYLPASYFENTLKVHSNVLFMHDGQNLFNASTSFAGVAWQCQDTVNELVVEGTMEEIVIVGIDNTNDRLDEMTYSVDPDYGGGKGDIYLNFIESVVFPIVQSNYRVDLSNNATLGILGSSLGGLISCYAGFTRSTYGKTGCMSSSFWWNNEDFNNVIMKQASPALSSAIFYVDSGDSGPDNDDETQTKTVVSHFETLGYKLGNNLQYYLDKGGQHSEYFWGQRFYVPMNFLYAVNPTDPK